MRRYMTMTEMALEALRRAILVGELPSGTQLVPAKLESVLDLSKESIRDAIRQLSGTGLVDSITNKGVYVCYPPSLNEIREIYKLRLGLEPNIAVRASRDFTDRDFELLEQLCLQMGQAEQSKSFKDHFILNREFHLALYQPSGWDCLCRSVGQWLDQILVFRGCLCITDMSLDLGRFNEEHNLIIEALKSGDEERIKALVKNNVATGMENIEKNCSEELLKTPDIKLKK